VPGTDVLVQIAICLTHTVLPTRLECKRLLDRESGSPDAQLIPRDIVSQTPICCLIVGAAIPHSVSRHGRCQKIYKRRISRLQRIRLDFQHGTALYRRVLRPLHQIRHVCFLFEGSGVLLPLLLQTP
jgi:hypothetical protein